MPIGRSCLIGRIGAKMTGLAKVHYVRKEELEMKSVCTGHQSLFYSHCLECPSLPLPNVQIPGLTQTSLKHPLNPFILLKDSSWFLGFYFYLYYGTIFYFTSQNSLGHPIDSLKEGIRFQIYLCYPQQSTFSLEYKELHTSLLNAFIRVSQLEMECGLEMIS